MYDVRTNIPYRTCDINILVPSWAHATIVATVYRNTVLGPNHYRLHKYISASAADPDPKDPLNFTGYRSPIFSTNLDLVKKYSLLI